MFAGFPPERENRSGARWNPPETAAIYTSLEQATARAEADYQIRMQPCRPKAQRMIYRISVSLSSVIQLSDWEALRELGVEEATFETTNYFSSQAVGGAAEWLGHDGLIVPSARAKGNNLVIFSNKRKPDHRFEVLDWTEINT
jgi:RES domain-containing protein